MRLNVRRIGGRTIFHTTTKVIDGLHFRLGSVWGSTTCLRGQRRTIIQMHGKKPTRGHETKLPNGIKSVAANNRASMNSPVNYSWLSANKVLACVIGLTFLTTCSVMAENKEYTVRPRADGGYSIVLTVIKRHWQPITAEDFFPKERQTYRIEIVGGGKDWTFRNQAGFYYNQDSVSCKSKSWDFGYAWVDAKRENIYLNFFWVSAPDSTTPSDINGKCRIVP